MIFWFGKTSPALLIPGEYGRRGKYHRYAIVK